MVLLGRHGPKKYTTGSLRGTSATGMEGFWRTRWNTRRRAGEVSVRDTKSSSCSRAIYGSGAAGRQIEDCHAVPGTVGYVPKVFAKT